MQKEMREAFERIFGKGEEPTAYFAPGRVNLIGEHTDYNGGHVFPCALSIGTYVLARKNSLGQVRMYSLNFERLGMVCVPAKDFVYDRRDNWCNYPKGVMWTYGKNGYVMDSGLDILYKGNIPNGSGLSSSASVEVVTAVVLNDQFGFDVDMIKVSQLCQYSENHFNGVNCGIMDQFAIAMGKKDHAIFLDTADLSFTYAPLELGSAKIVIACSNKKRGLADSKYNERRSQCEEALRQIRTVKDVPSLGALTEAEFEEAASAITDPVNRRRAKHAVCENQRTIRAVAALEAGDIAEFGRLMNASHVSLRDDYEVTGIELDTLVEEAWKQPGVIGSRMTGAGFGGCTVSIVEDSAIESFIANVGKAYRDKIGYAADFYTVTVGDGAHRL